MEMTLPRDLEDEILSRVPDKSLARFRCVCKQWNTQLVEETFLAQHSSRMHNYSGDDQFLGDNQIIIKGDRNRINSVASPSLKIEDLTLKNRKIVHEFGCRIRVYKIVQCTGLLVCVMENQLLIWNPYLKVTRWIKCSSDFHRFDDAYALGFIRQSPTLHNYKIVRFRCAHNSRDRPSRVEVYDFTSNRWKIITDLISFDWHLRVPLSSASLGGNSYWIGLWEDSTAFIQSFDYSKEKFQPLGHIPFRYDEHNPLALGNFRGNRLCLLEQCHQTRKISIWVRHLITPWTILMVLAIPHFPLLYETHRSRFSAIFFVDRNDTLVTSCFNEAAKSIRIFRVKDKEFQKVYETTAGNTCVYVPSLAHP
ncbi:unnamed protein product, partial [Arabidopsis halleri]